MNSTLLEKYYQLRSDIDKVLIRLEMQHKSSMKCEKGCDSCCESLTIFPIEFDAIKKELGNSVVLPKKKFLNNYTKSCRFLVKGICSIYESRPIICRTQGLPLLYESIKGNDFELSVCKLNFVGADISKFNMENSLFMPPFNSRLFLLNKEYIEQDLKYSSKSTKRIKLNTL